MRNGANPIVDVGTPYGDVSAEHTRQPKDFKNEWTAEEGRKEKNTSRKGQARRGKCGFAYILLAEGYGAMHRVNQPESTASGPVFILPIDPWTLICDVARCLVPPPCLGEYTGDDVSIDSGTLPARLLDDRGISTGTAKGVVALCVMTDAGGMLHSIQRRCD